jgi:molybdopterin-containing oxidoreductase family iron-sulfur binding subunit
MQYGFAIDTQRCIGCHTCAVMCRIENNVPRTIWWNRIMTNGGSEMDTPAGEFPNVMMSYVPLNCQHCENPACTRVCPVGATYKDANTGIVHQDYDKCIGCRMCIAACPYTGVRSFNWEEPQHVIDFPTGDPSIATHQKHVVEKCTLCSHRLAKGEQPVCIKVCPARARYCGDLDDPRSEVSTIIRTRQNKQLLPEVGTNPSVYYLV